MPVVGFLGSGALTDRMTAFRQGLKEAGFVEDQNVAIGTKVCLPTAHTRAGVSYRTFYVRFFNHELRLLLVPAQGRKGAHPRQRRVAPVLPAWDEVTALVQDSHPYHVGRLLPVPRRGRINRRAAAWTERLQASIAALGRGLEVCRRLARYAKGCTGNGNINAEGGAGANLAIRAVANRGLLGVRFAFDPDIAAVARAVDFHEFVPFRRSASAIAFIGTPAQVPSSFGPYIMMRFWPP